MTQTWRDIENRLNFSGAEMFARDEITPLLAELAPETLDKDGTPKGVQMPFFLTFVIFVIAFSIFNGITPDNFIGVTLNFIMFPVLFFGSFAFCLYQFRDRFLGLFIRGQGRFLARANALTMIAQKLDLQYIPSPGGAPAGLSWIAKQKRAPAAIKQAAATLDAHGGMDAPLAAAKASGVLVDNVIVIGSEEQKRHFQKDQAANRTVEDGFEGVRGGVHFSAFEWVEPVDEEPNIHHLVLVFDLPRPLYGVTQLRSRKTQWPSAPDGVDMDAVGLVATPFEKKFRLRTNDQVEARNIFDPAVIERLVALAHDEKVRAAAFDEHLVFDVAGADRFALVDLVTGAWSEETIKSTLINIAEMLELVDAVADAFRLTLAR